MRMKATITVLLCFVLTIIITGCGSTKSDNNPSEATATPTATPATTNLIANGDFTYELGDAASDETWGFYGGTDPSVTRTTYTGLTGYCLKITATDFSATQLRLDTASYETKWFTLTAGKTYTVKFKAVASESASVKFILQKTGEWLVSPDYNITTSIQTYTVTVPAQNTDTLVNLLFTTPGNSSENNPNTSIYFDDFQLYAN